MNSIRWNPGEFASGMASWKRAKGGISVLRGPGGSNSPVKGEVRQTHIRGKISPRSSRYD